MVDVLERFQVLLQKEESIYKTSDYLAMIEERKRNVLVPVNTNQISPPCSKRRKCTMDKGQEDQHFRRAGKENCGYPNNDGNHSSLDSNQFYKYYREKMCEWAYRVIDHLDLSRELVIISMSHLDRYLAVHPEAIKNTSLFRLLTMTCVYLSIKLNEYKHLIALPSESESSTTMDAMLMLGRGLFTRAQMEKMEYDLLQRLQWHVHPPTAPLFLHYLLRFLSVVDHDVRDLAHFQIELSAMNYFFVPYKASEVAAAALLNALEQTHLVSNTQIDFSDLPFDCDTSNIRACRKQLSRIYTDSLEQPPVEIPDDNDSQPQKRSARIEKGNRSESPASVMDAASITP